METGKANNLNGTSTNATKANPNPSTGEQSQTPVASTKSEAALKEEKELNEEYLDVRSVTVALVNNYSLYRKANDKALPKRNYAIGSSIKSSRTLSSNRSEVEDYFPAIVGVAANHETFLTRVKQYLANIRIPVDELGRTFNTSFRYKTKRDYLSFKEREEAIERKFESVNRQNLREVKAALETKITELNNLESEKHKYGYPVDVEDYIKYRHCLLYKDVAKDMSIINSDPNIRFYIKDDNREKDLIAKRRQAIVDAKRNYVDIISDTDKLNAVYIQYCVHNNYSVQEGLAKSELEKFEELNRYSDEEPVKFNNMCKDKDLAIKAYIERLISRGEFIRANDNQNISTPTGEFIGSNIKEAVLWWKNPNNAAAVEAYKNKLNY